MWELDHKESWAPKNRCFWTVVLEKTLESPLNCKEIQPVHLRENQLWIFIGRTDAEAETPILWLLDEKWLIGKDPDARKDWGQEEKGMMEDEMVGWHHQLDGHEFEQAPGVGDGQGGPAHGRQSMGLQRVRHNWATELNWTETTGKFGDFPKGHWEVRTSDIICGMQMKAWTLNPNAKTFQTANAEQEAKHRCLLSEAPCISERSSGPWSCPGGGSLWKVLSRRVGFWTGQWSVF